ncbi:MAG TPA: hypothetical protein VG672_29340 [Bryobacteraceae bacterium]|nr:hypothetical protein [Bryobacteraceae bacterium]
MKYSIRAFPVAELPAPGWECFFGRNDVSFHKLIFHVWLIQGGGKNILVDAGPPPDDADFSVLRDACRSIDPRSTMVRLRTLDAVFAEAGMHPEQIDLLLITQPITYHTGGLSGNLFPHATVCLSRAGMMEFLLDNPGHPPKNCYFTESTWAAMHRLLLEQRLVVTDGPIQILEDLWFETTGGHHPGSAAVKVNTAKGVVGLLETAFLQENIEKELPVGVAENVSLNRQIIRRYKRECELALAIHDNALFERFPGGQIA